MNESERYSITEGNAFVATVDFTLEDLRTVVREEIGGTVPGIIQDTVPGIVRDLVPEIIHETVPGIVHGIVRQEILSEREYTQHMINEASIGVLSEVVKVRKMLEEDALAESERLTRVEKRLDKTTRILMSHIATPSAHGGQNTTI